MAETSCGRHRAVAGRGLQSGGKSSAVVLVVVDELWNGDTAVLLREEEFPTRVLLDVVVLDVRERPANHITVSNAKNKGHE